MTIGRSIVTVRFVFDVDHLGIVAEIRMDRVHAMGFWLQLDFDLGTASRRSMMDLGVTDHFVLGRYFVASFQLDLDLGRVAR